MNFLLFAAKNENIFYLVEDIDLKCQFDSFF